MKSILYVLSITLSLSLPATQKVDLTKAKFLTLADFATTETFKGEEVLHYEGAENIAILDGPDFTNGIIEFEIAFAYRANGKVGVPGGIAFRATEEKFYDCIFFTPVSKDNGNEYKKGFKDTIRYTSRAGGKLYSHGYYKILRDFIGKYNAGSDKFNFDGWTKVKLVIKGKNLKVYIADSEKPDFELKKLMGKRKSGKIALWGYNNYYRNLKITPLDAEVAE